MARDPERNAAGSAVPRLEYANALRIQVPQIWKRVRELLESALGGAPLVTVSGAATCATERRGGWWTATTAVPSWSRSSA